MENSDLLGSFEQLVLLAIVRLKDAAYGMTVRQEIEKRTGRSVSLGAVYATLDRLEAKGYVSSRKAAGSPERQGRAKRFFRVESTGAAALQQSLRAIENMRAGVPGLKRQLGGIG
jgi:DNA-binding PadR family transcriptional regulator